MKPTTLFEMLLASVGAVVDDQGLVSMTRPDEDPIPWTINGKRLAVPHTSLLREGAFNDDGGLVAFQPFCENVVLDPSPVLEALEKAMLFQITLKAKELMVQLVRVAANPAAQKKMRMAAQKVLSVLPDANERTVKDFVKILESTSAAGKKPFAALYVRNGGLFGGDKVNRLGKFYPRIVDELEKDSNSVYGVDLRKKDVPAFLGLVEYLFPGYTDPDTYSAPSNSTVAPTFHALIKTFYKVAAQLNKIIDIHAPHLENADALRFELGWREAVDDLTPYRDQLPVLPGNDGKEGIKTQRTRVEKGPVAAVINPPRKEGGSSVSDMLAKLTPQAPQGWGSNQSERLQPSGFRANQVSMYQRQRELEQMPDWARPAEPAPVGRWGGHTAARTFSSGGGGGFSGGGRGGRGYSGGGSSL